MGNKKIVTIIAIFIVLLATAAVLGCTSSSSQTDKATPTPTPTAAPTAAPTPAPTAAPTVAPTTTAAPTIVSSPTPTPYPWGGIDQSYQWAHPNTILTVTGLVNSVTTFTLGDLQGFTQHYAHWNNTKGSYYDGTGPLLTDVIARAGLKSGATTLTFTCSDGMTCTMAISDMNSVYSNAIIACNWTGYGSSGAYTNTTGTVTCIVPSGSGKINARWCTQITVS